MVVNEPHVVPACAPLTNKSLAEELFGRPFARYNEVAVVAALQAEVKNGIIEKANQPKLDAFVAGWRSN